MRMIISCCARSEAMLMFFFCPDFLILNLVGCVLRMQDLIEYYIFVLYVPGY